MPTTKSLSRRQKICLVLCGVLSGLFLVEVSLQLTGLTLLAVQDYRSRVALGEKESIRILCLGESTTFLGYPAYLEEILNERVSSTRFDVIDKSVPVINTTYILKHLNSNLEQHHPDIVVAMIGINDGGLVVRDTLPTRFGSSLARLKLANFIRILQQGFVGERDAQRGGNTLPDTVPLSPRHDEAVRSDDYGTLVGEARGYRARQQWTEAEEIFKRAISVSPHRFRAYWALAGIYFMQGRDSYALEIFQKGMEMAGHPAAGYIELGIWYTSQENYAAAEETFKKALEMKSVSSRVYIELGKLYQLQQRFDELEGLFAEATELFPGDDTLCGFLANYYTSRGRSDVARYWSMKARRLRLTSYSRLTQENYSRLVKMVSERGMKMICVQYPMRSVQTLRRLIEQPGHAIFVDNERRFREAVRREGYHEYFQDVFAGDFGHLTAKGNRLLAENIAGAILGFLSG